MAKILTIPFFYFDVCKDCVLKTAFISGCHITQCDLRSRPNLPIQISTSPAFPGQVSDMDLVNLPHPFIHKPNINHSFQPYKTMAEMLVHTCVILN